MQPDNNISARAFTAVVLLACLISCSGCITYVGTLAEDHTIGIISRPVTAPVELLWRVTTLGTEAADRLKIRYIKFPRLDKVPIPAIAQDRRYMSDSKFDRWLRKKAAPSVPANFSLLIGGDQFFPRFEKAIEAATNQIDMQTYIFDNDDVGVHFADLLRKRSTDIRIRILMDGVGCRRAWSTDPQSLGDTSMPRVGSIARYLRYDSNIKVRRWYNLWLASNHSKLILVDNTKAFIGGMNIGREYRYEWRDAMVEVTGPFVVNLSRSFLNDWNRSRFLSDLFLFRYKRQPMVVAPENGPRTYLLRTTPFKRRIYRAMVHAADSASHHIYVETPYLWNDKIVYSLCKARKRGVDVRVTVPAVPNVPGAAAATRVALNTLLSHGVRVFLYPGMTHVKAAVYDGWACFGSANLDDLSLHKNTELNIITDDPQFVSTFETDLLVAGQDMSKEITGPIPLSAWDILAERLADFL